MSSKEKIPVWLDCDPGHDDAFAILLATHSPTIELLGISIVHGNDTVEHCAKNAVRFLWACGVHGVKVHKGIETPLIREPKFCPEIHGIPGEQGVAGMCGYHFPDDMIFSDQNYRIEETHGVIAMANAIKSHVQKVTVVLTGAQTNFAFALRMFPDINENIEKVVFMGGAIGLGNTGVAAEFNIQIDPEAATVVFHSGIPLVMIPLEVTHKVLVTSEILRKLENIDNEQLEDGHPKQPFSPQKLPHRHVEYSEIRQSVDRRLRMDGSDDTIKAQVSDIPHYQYSSPFAKCCSKLLTFFQTTYCKEFGFPSPPLHDPCTIFYLMSPGSFHRVPLFVDVETGSEKCAGRTLCDINNLSKKPANISVCTDIDVEAFWQTMLRCVQQASSKSPMNET